MDGNRDLQPLLHELITYPIYDLRIRKGLRPALFSSETQLNETQIAAIDAWFEGAFPELKNSIKRHVLEIKELCRGLKVQPDDEKIRAIFQGTFPNLKDVQHQHLDSFERAISGGEIQAKDKDILGSITTDVIYDFDPKKQKIIVKGSATMLDKANEIRALLLHPCPQNQKEGKAEAVHPSYLYAGQVTPENGVIYGEVFFERNGKQGHERQGLLSLTS